MLSKYSQTLDEVIKQAHVYANPLEEDELEKTAHKKACTYASNKNRSLNNNSNNKPKNNNDTNAHVKRTKPSLKPILKEDFE